MKKHFIMNTGLVRQGLICATTIFSCVALYADHEKGTSPDLSFMKEAAQGGKMEVQMGQLGKDKGQSEELKRFADRLIQDHTKANNDLMAIAQKEGVDLTSKDHMDHELKNEDKLSNKSGADFDKAFTRYMIRDHKKDISKFEKEAKSGSDPEVKDFANKCLPTLREHLRMAQDLGKTMGLTYIDLNSEADQVNSGNPASIESGASASAAKDSESTVNAQSRATIDNGVNASTSVSTTPEKPHKFLGLSTDKNDGKILGLFPAPGHKSAEASVSTDTTPGGIGAPAPSVNGTASSDSRNLAYSDLPAPVQHTIQTETGGQDIKRARQETKNGKTCYRVEVQKEGRNRRLTINEDGTLVKDNGAVQK